MRILVVGSGGREHALAWACARHESAPEIVCAPGNAGTAELGANVPVAVTDGPALARLGREREADLVIIGHGRIHGHLGRLRTNSYAIIREAPCPVLSL